MRDGSDFTVKLNAVCTFKVSSSYNFCSLRANINFWWILTLKEVGRVGQIILLEFQIWLLLQSGVFNQKALADYIIFSSSFVVWCSGKSWLTLCVLKSDLNCDCSHFFWRAHKYIRTWSCYNTQQTGIWFESGFFFLFMFRLTIIFISNKINSPLIIKRPT